MSSLITFALTLYKDMDYKDITIKYYDEGPSVDTVHDRSGSICQDSRYDSSSKVPGPVLHWIHDGGWSQSSGGS